MTNYQNEQFPIPTPWRLVRELRLKRPPWWMVGLLVVAILGTWIPLAMIYEARTTKSRAPRVHFFLDMDKQPKFGPQAAHPWFLDGRAMRLPVSGTIARGRLTHDQPYSLGYLTSDGTPQGTVTEFVKSLPSQLAEEGESLIARGKQRYGIYCALCHGATGAGDGPVNQRALELKETKWVPATNLMTQMIRDRADGQLFQAITDGVRNMPSYGAQISPRDRWAIVAYVRQMQATQPVAKEPASPPVTTTGPAQTAAPKN
jgi:mono/diheme cytochrome c family protein